MVESLKYLPFLAKHYLEVSRFEKWSPEKIERFQVKAFRKIFKAAVKIPFYKELYERAGVHDAQINSLKDLERLPVIDKAFCRENGYEDYFMDKNFPGTLITPTSGSTGKPFQVRISRKIEMVPPVKVIHAMHQFGWHPLMKGLQIWREDSTTHKDFMQKAGLLKFASIFWPLEEIRKKIEEEKPGYIFFNRSIGMVLADYFNEKGYSYKPEFLMTTAEEVSPEQRQKLEGFFHTRLLNVYGCIETPTIAYSCPEHNNLHVFQTTVIVELINRRMIDGEEYGEMVVTNLVNKFMPFIRYKTGDIVKVVHEKCGCGRNSQVIGDISGRSDDVIVLKDGRVFNYNSLWHRMKKRVLLDNEHRIEQYKVWHYKEDDRLVFQFRLNRNVSKEDGAELIESILEEYFSDVKYGYEIVDSIPLSKSGKFKIIEIVED
jgi:phenylacetate-CoA ligase